MNKRKTLSRAVPAQDTANLILSSIALNLLSLALPIMTLQVYDRILPNPHSGTLPILIIGVCVALGLETCLRLTRSWIMGWQGAVYEYHMTTRAMDHILSSDVSRSNHKGIGRFLHQISAIGKTKDFNNGYLQVTFTEVLFIPVFLGLILYIAPQLVLIPIAVLMIFTFISFRQGQMIHEKMDARDQSDDDRYDFLISCLSSMHTLKTFSLEKLLSRRYEGFQEKSGAASFRTAIETTTAVNTAQMLSHVMMAVIITVGAVFVVSGNVTTGALIATLQLSGRLMQPVQRGLSLWLRFQDYKISKKKISDIFDLPLRSKNITQNLPEPKGILKIDNVYFKNILKGVNLHIEPGEVIAIHGKPSSGKSVLMEMIAGVFAPDTGSILIDGIDSDTIPAQDMARYVGYMPPKTAIFHGTIRDNITRFGLIKEEKVQEIARLLRIDEDISHLPAGFDTVLQTQNADDVSLGLRQRIALTRILATRPKIILFDEADQSLDREGYNLLFRLLAKMQPHVSLILISEDLNITSLASRHYVLEHGILKEGSET